MILAWLFRLLKIEVIPPQEVQARLNAQAAALDRQQHALQASIVAINQAVQNDR